LIDFRLLKLLSKKINVTINDIVTSALSTSMNVLFKENKDQAQEFSVVMPANIRFKFYATPKDIKLDVIKAKINAHIVASIINI